MATHPAHHPSHHGRQPTPQDIIDEVKAHGYQRLTLDGLEFWMNPESFSDTQEQLRVVAQTAAGYGDYDYGAKPAEIVISGTTGNAGVDGPGGIRQMERFRPRVGRVSRLLQLRYPIEGNGTRYLKVDLFRRSREVSGNNKLWVRYEIRAREFPLHEYAVAHNVSGRIGSTPFPIGG